MKGIYFQKPFEFQLLVEGESWHQGSAVRGTLVIRNHGAEALPLDGVRVALAHGRASRVKSKTEGALKILHSVQADGGRSLAPSAEERLPWVFHLDRNAPITDKASSLYLLYGLPPVPGAKAESGDKAGLLQLIVEPDGLFDEFLRVFQIQHHFVIKSRHAGKGSVGVKLIPPGSKGLASIEQLELRLRIGEGERLEVGYIFELKNINGSVAGVEVTTSERELEQTLERSEYLTSSGRVNHERMEAAVSEAFARIGS